MTKKFPTAIRWFRSDNRQSKIQNRKLAGAVAIAFAICGAVVEAQQPGKIPRMGYLGANTGSRGSLYGALRQGLRDLSYVEGQNIAIEIRSPEGNFDRHPSLASELVRLKVDIIFASGNQAAVAAKKATSTIPIIFVGAVDPVATGLVASLARPGGNVTGFSVGAPGLNGKRLEIIKETIPRLTRVGVLLNPTNPSVGLKEIRSAGQELGVQIQSFEVRSPSDIDHAFEAATKAQAGALIVSQQAPIISNQKRIVKLPRSAGYRRYTRKRIGLMLVVSCLMDRAILTCTGVPPSMSTRSSRERNPLIYPCSSRSNTN